MSALKTVLDVGAQFIPGVGEAIDAGLGTSLHFRFLLFLLLFLSWHP